MSDLSLRGITKRFGGLTAVDEVELDVANGQRHAVIGPNGAGKSTLLSMIAGSQRPTAGRVELLGRDVTGWKMHKIARIGVGRTFQHSGRFAEETLLDNCLLAASAHRRLFSRLGSDGELRQAAGEALEQVALDRRADDPASALSHGESRQLEIAMALASRPRLLLADEPLAGLSEHDRERIGGLLRSLSRDVTMLFIEHDLEFVLGTADHVTVLDFGRVISRGTPAEVRADPRVVEIYMGDATTDEAAPAAPSSAITAPTAVPGSAAPTTTADTTGPASVAPATTGDSTTPAASAVPGPASTVTPGDTAVPGSAAATATGDSTTPAASAVPGSASTVDSAAAALNVAGLRSGYGAAEVINGIDLRAATGRVLAVLGRNGVGKTTLLRTIMGHIGATTGTVSLHGSDVSNLRTSQRARAGLALVPQGRGILHGLTVEEQLLVGQRSGRWTPERVYEWFPVLAERRRQLGTTLSGGEQQMLAIGRALLRNPAVIMLDEPSEGLAPLLVRRVGEIVRQLAAEGECIVLAEQNVRMAIAVADDVIVVDRGIVTHRGPAAELREDEQRQHELLGF